MTLRRATAPITKAPPTPKKPRKRLRAVGKKRKAKIAARRAARTKEAEANVPAPTPALDPKAPLEWLAQQPLQVRREFVRLFNRPLPPKSAEFVSVVLMERVHRMACRGCGKPKVTAQHFPARAVVGVRDDRLIIPYCGDGVFGCHGKAQRYEIPAEKQCEDVGFTMAVFVKEGLLGWPGVEQALRAVPRRDWAHLMRLALIQALADEDGA